MKKKLINAYCIFVGILFLLAIGLFGYNLISEYSQGESRSEKRFEYLCLSLKQFYEKNDFQNLNRTDEIIGNFQDFSQILITVDNVNIFSFPASISTISDSNSKFIKKYYKCFTINSFKVEITTLSYLLRPTDIGKYAKVSFLIVLIATIITILLIIITTITENKSDLIIEEKNNEEIEDSVEKNVDEILAECKNNIESQNIHTILEDNTSEKIEAAETVVITEPTVTTEATIDESVSEEKATEETISVETISSEITPTKNIELSNNSEQNSKIEEEISEESFPEELIETEKEIPDTENIKLPVEEIKPMEIVEEKVESVNPVGLFSPNTGIGWESYMKTRLENELNRAISSEIDLALFIIKIPGITRDCAVIKEICDYLIIQFQFKDLLFEYKEDCIVAIKISTNLDEALSLAERLNEDINKMLEDYPSKCFIGISTRTIRMMSSERLLKEADEALLHAQEDDDSPIIAFRADAIKYQKFLETTI